MSPDIGELGSTHATKVADAEKALDLAECRFHRESVRLATDPYVSNRYWFDAKKAVEIASARLKALQVEVS